MKTLVLPTLLCMLAFPLAAESDAWVGYVTYAPSPVQASIPAQDNDLKWLAELARLVGTDGFTFLGRRDADHWAALTNQGTAWLLQIHDESARFNFRATVNPKTGRFTVHRGVDWAGSDRAADANKAAGLALAYIERARLSLDLFPKPEVASAVHDPAPATHDAAPATHDASAPVHGDMQLGTGGADQWQRLVDGNLRFVSGKVMHPNQSMARIAETAKGQKPFAVVVTCSDSRVPPEVLFDQGIGDLFVIRTAGEVVTEVELGSIEYAVEHLGVTYLVVLGHERCGAVDATLKGGDLPPNIEAIAAQIRPAVEAARFFKGDPLDNAVRENAKVVLAKIKGDELLVEAMHAGKLNVKAAYYDLDTGKVAALP